MMENRIAGSRVFLNQTEYQKIHNIKTGERCVMVLQDKAGCRYVLKLVKAQCSEADRWREAYQISYEKLSGLTLTQERRRRGIRVPRVLAVYHRIDTDSGSACGLLMEHIDGRPLEKVLHDLTTAELLELLSAVIATVRYVNRHLGYYHMDISPNNILIDCDGDAWLIDYEGAYRLYENNRWIVCSTAAAPTAAEPSVPDAHRCEWQQCRMLLNMLENRLEPSKAAALMEECEAAESPLAKLHLFIRTFRANLF